MTNTINEALIPFRDNFLPYVRSMISQATSHSTIIMKAYADLLNSGSSEEEDRKLLAELRHHHDLIMHSLIHELDMLEHVGDTREVERYINFIDGEPVEVDKSQFIGLLTDD